MDIVIIIVNAPQTSPAAFFHQQLDIVGKEKCLKVLEEQCWNQTVMDSVKAFYHYYTVFQVPSKKTMSHIFM